MNIILNIIVLIFEVFYYSLFMRYSKNEGNFWKYFTLFAFISVTGGFIGTDMFISFAYLIFGSLLAMKYLVKVKTTYFDLFSIIGMIIFKYAIELIFYLPLGNIINYYILMTFVGIFKIIIAYLVRDIIRKFYMYLIKKWNNNVFYVRYICTCFLYIYFIVCAIHIFFFIR